MCCMATSRIFIFSPQDPTYATDGGKQALYHSVSHLAQKYSLTVAYPSIFLSPPRLDHPHLKDVQWLPLPLDTRDKALDLLRNIGSQIPFKMQKYRNFSSDQIILSILENEKFDFFILLHAHMGVYLPLLKKFKNPIYLIEYNLEYEIVFQFFRKTQSILKKVISFWQARKTLTFEQDLWKKTDQNFFISYQDFKSANTIIPGKNILAYPMFPSTEQIPKISTSTQSDFLWMGSLKSLQNQHNLIKFLDNVWFKFHHSFPKVRLFITGNDDKTFNEFIKKPYPGVVNLGFLDSLDEILSTGPIVLSPTYFGSGVRYKILHALSLGLIVFCTKEDEDTIHYFKDMENLIVFKDSLSFIEKYKTLMNSQELQIFLRKNALKLMNGPLSPESFLLNFPHMNPDIPSL